MPSCFRWRDFGPFTLAPPGACFENKSENGRGESCAFAHFELLASPVLQSPVNISFIILILILIVHPLSSIALAKEEGLAKEDVIQNPFTVIRKSLATPRNAQPRYSPSTALNRPSQGKSRYFAQPNHASRHFAANQNEAGAIAAWTPFPPSRVTAIGCF